MHECGFFFGCVQHKREVKHETPRFSIRLICATVIDVSEIHAGYMQPYIIGLLHSVQNRAGMRILSINKSYISPIQHSHLHAAARYFIILVQKCRLHPYSQSSLSKDMHDTSILCSICTAVYIWNMNVTSHCHACGYIVCRVIS